MMHIDLWIYGKKVYFCAVKFGCFQVCDGCARWQGDCLKRGGRQHEGHVFARAGRDEHVVTATYYPTMGNLHHYGGNL